MRQTKKVKEQYQENAICVSRTELPQLLGCGQATADKISVEAGARIKIGKRVLIKIDSLRIKTYSRKREDVIPSS